MAKRRQRIAKEIAKAKQRDPGGPYLGCAVFCDSILEDKDGVTSAMRIVDTVNLYIPPEAPSDVPSAANPIGFTQHLLVIFRPGSALGNHTLKLVVESATGKRKEVSTRELTFTKKKTGGITVRIHAGFTVEKSGMLWLDVILNGKTYTRVPLNVLIHRVKLS